MGDNKWVAVDICGTIYRSNTTFDFLEWMFDDSRMFLAFSVCRRTYVWRGVNKFVMKMAGLDLTRMMAVRFLKGHSREELTRKVGVFHRDCLSKKRNDDIVKLIHHYINADSVEVCLLSATLDIIAEEVSNGFGEIPYYATQLEFTDDGICTGKIKHDLLGRKVTLLEKISPLHCVITDDISDFQLVEKAEKSEIVVYQRTLKRWENKLIAADNCHVNFISNRF